MQGQGEEEMDGPLRKEEEVGLMKCRTVWGESRCREGCRNSAAEEPGERWEDMWEGAGPC